MDGRKRPVRGLWVRRGRFYARMRLLGEKDARRVCLEAATTVPEARALMEKLKTQRADNTLPILRETPRLADYIDQYLADLSAGVGTKTAKTIVKERSQLKLWAAELGTVRLPKITRARSHFKAMNPAFTQSAESSHDQSSHIQARDHSGHRRCLWRKSKVPFRLMV